VEAETTERKSHKCKGWELPALHGITDDRAARLERLGQLACRIPPTVSRTRLSFLPAESLLNVLVQVIALEDDTIAPELPYLSGGFLPTHDIQRFDSCEFASLMMYCPTAELAAV